MPHASLLFSGVSNAESRRGWDVTATTRACQTAQRIWLKQICPGNYGRWSMSPSPLPLGDLRHLPQVSVCRGLSPQPYPSFGTPGTSTPRSARTGGWLLPLVTGKPLYQRGQSGPPNQLLDCAGCLLAVMGAFWCMWWTIGDFSQVLPKRLKAAENTNANRCLLERQPSPNG